MRAPLVHAGAAKAGEHLIDLRDHFGRRLLAVHHDRRMGGIAIGATRRLNVGRAQRDLNLSLHPVAAHHNVFVGTAHASVSVRTSAK